MFRLAAFIALFATAIAFIPAGRMSSRSAALSMQFEDGELTLHSYPNCLFVTVDTGDSAYFLTPFANHSFNPDRTRCPPSCGLLGSARSRRRR